MAQARRELRGVVKAAEAMQDVGKTLTAYVSAPLAALGALSVKVGGDFQAAFNRVEAATQATGAELDALRAKTKNIALDPTLKFSATQAAAALENLAKNGLSTQQILNGAADATVNLATATGGQLATSADIATDVINNFNLTATELAASVNNITGTTIASKLDIDNYRMALGQAGGVAGQLGVKFTDFNTALAVTSSGFSSGSDAGTSFKTFLQRLVPQSKEAEQAMRQLGLKFFDAQGQMKPLREIAGQLQQAFKGLSDQQKSDLGTKIFGSDSIRTALLLAKDGAEGFDKMAESIGKVNAAAQGKTLSQGFNGALEGLKSAFEGLHIAIAESGILDFATKIVRGLGEFTSTLAKLDPAVLSTITTLAGIAIAVGPVLLAIGSLGAALPALTAGFSTLGITSLAAFTPMLVPAAALAAVALAIYENWDELRPVFAGVAESVANATREIGAAVASLSSSTDLGGLLAGSLSVVSDAVRGVAVGFTALADVVGGTIGFITRLFKGDFKEALDQGERAVRGLFAPIADLFGFSTKAATELKGSFAAAFEPIEVVTGLLGGDLAAANATAGAATKQFTALSKEQTDALNKQALALQKLNEGYDNIGARSVFKPEVTPDFALKVPKLEGLPTRLEPVDITPFVASLQEATGQMAQFQLAGEMFTAGLGPVLVGGLQSIAVGVGEAVGNMALGIGGLDSVFAALLSGVGSLAVQLGTLAIGTGIAVAGIKAALETLNPVVAIAGGIALVALGTAVKGAAASIGRSGGSGGVSLPSGGGASIPRSNFTPSTAPGAAAGGPTTITHNVVIGASGRDLAGVLTINTDRLGRIVGRPG